MKQIPEFLLNLYNDTQKETRPFSKIFAFINLSEAVIKFYTVVTVQNFLETETGNPSLEEGKAVLGKGLARPSLGLWAFFTERITGLIPKDKFFWENFPDFFEKDLKPATAILVNLRNKYHHGAVPSNEECTKDLNEAEPYLKRILFEGLIGEDRILIGNVIQNAKAKEVFLERADGRRLELSPLMHAEFSNKSKKEELYYFNDAKKWDKGTINTMSYDVGEHVSNKNIFNEFRKSFPIPDWEKTKVSRFASRIAELTENFQGRDTELSKIKKFLNEYTQGFFFIWGGPGIGKSALIARSLVLVRAGLEEKNHSSETGFDLGTKDIIVLEYFIRRATITEKEDTFYSMLGEDLEDIFKTGISIGNNLQEKKEKWRARLEKIQRKLNGSESIRNEEKSEEKESSKSESNAKSSNESFVGKKLILCIDGLDEGEEGILRSIPRGSDLYSSIIFVLGGRDVTQTRTLYTTLDADKKTELILNGLGEADIRAIMLKVSQPENLLSEYIAKLLKVSEGVPLYLKMICESIERGERQAGDVENLPSGVDNLYDEIYNRFFNLKDSDILLKILYFFTFAKDFLSVDVVAYFLNLEYYQAEFYIGEIREVLWENPMTEDVDDFQLFHESFRDYLRKKYDKKRFEVQNIILNGLYGWKELCDEGIDPRTARYILKYGVTHLLEEGEQKQAEMFVLNSDFVRFQVEYLNFYTASLDDSAKVLNAIVEEIGGKPCTTKSLEVIFNNKIERTEFRTTTLAKLVKHSGDLGKLAGSDIAIAWTWVDEEKLEDALERLSPIQDKQRLFDCYMLVVWLLTLKNDTDNNRDNINLTIKNMEKNIPNGISVAKWNYRYSELFIAKICYILSERNFMVNFIFERGDDSTKYLLVEKIIDLYKENNNQNYILNYEISSNLLLYFIQLCNNIKDDLSKKSILVRIKDFIIRYGDENKITYFIPLIYDTIKKIQDNIMKSNLLTDIYFTSLKYNISDLSKLFLSEAINSANLIGNPSLRSRELSILAESISKNLGNELAKDLFKKAIKTVDKINNDFERGLATVKIAESLAHPGNKYNSEKQYLEALKFANNIKKKYDQTELQIIIAESLYRTSNNDQSIETYNLAIRNLNEISVLKSKCKLIVILLHSFLVVNNIHQFKIYINKLLENISKLESEDDKFQILESFLAYKSLNINELQEFYKGFINVLNNLQDNNLYFKLFKLIINIFYNENSSNEIHNLLLGSINRIIVISNFYEKYSLIIIVNEILVFIKNSDVLQKIVSEILVITDTIDISNEHIRIFSTLSKSLLSLEYFEFNQLLYSKIQSYFTIENSYYDNKYYIDIIEYFKHQNNNLYINEIKEKIFNFTENSPKSDDSSLLFSNYGIYFYLNEELLIARELLTTSLKINKSSDYNLDPFKTIIEVIENINSNKDELAFKKYFSQILELVKISTDFYNIEILIKIIIKINNWFSDKNYFIIQIKNLKDIIINYNDTPIKIKLLFLLAESINNYKEDELTNNITQDCNSIIQKIEMNIDRFYSLIHYLEFINNQKSLEEAKIVVNNLFEIIDLFEIEEINQNSNILYDLIYQLTKCRNTDIINSNYKKITKFSLKFKNKIDQSYFLIETIKLLKSNDNEKFLQETLTNLLENIKDIEEEYDKKIIIQRIFEILLEINQIEYIKLKIPDLLNIINSFSDEYKTEIIIFINEYFYKDKKFYKSIYPKLFSIINNYTNKKVKYIGLISIIETHSRNKYFNLKKFLFQSKIISFYGNFINGIVYKKHEVFYQLTVVHTKKIYFNFLVNKNYSILFDIIEFLLGNNDTNLQKELIIKLGNSLEIIKDKDLTYSIFPILLSLSHKLKNQFDRSQSLGSLLKNLLNFNDEEYLDRQLPELLRRGLQISDSNAKKYLVYNFSQCLVSYTNFTKKESIFNELLNFTNNIEDEYKISSALCSINYSLLESNSEELFMKFAFKILEVNSKIKDVVSSSKVLESFALTVARYSSIQTLNLLENYHLKNQSIMENSIAYTSKFREINWTNPDNQNYISYYIRSFNWVIQDQDFSLESINNLIITLSRLGKFDESLEIIKNIRTI